MIDVFDLYQSFNSTVNSFIGGWWRPNTDFVKKVNDVSKALWVKWTREAEKSREATDNLLPFLRSKNIIVDNKGIYGTFMPPKDYGRFAAARIIVSSDQTVPDKNVDNGKCENSALTTQEEITEKYYDSIEPEEVEIVDDQRWNAANKHLTKKPTFENPKIRKIDGGFQVAPRKISVVVLDYYVEPKEATFAYTIAPGNVQTGSGDNIVYDKKNSVPLEWPATVRDEFIIALGELYGVFVRDAFVAQLSKNQKQAT